MSTALSYPEPYRFSAGLLALLMHLVFFAVLYLGVHWQSQPPDNFMVEMWDSLPDTEIEPEQAPPPTAKMEPMPPPKVVSPVLPPVKADIEVRDKKSKKAEAKDKAKAAAKQEAERKELEAYAMRNRKLDQERVLAEQERVRAEVSVATQVQVERYQDLIRNKIRRKMKMVADVPANAEAIFRVTLLPDGMLMDDPVLIKSSGIPAYDNAAERAILSAEPLPVPTDLSLQKLFRELKLSIRP
ncbi:MAG: cell envelope integrity protein TolA [Sideroxyarcus sp.]